MGAIALLARSRFAPGLFIMSLSAVVTQFGYIFVVTDLIAVKGLLVAAGFPMLIFTIAVGQVWVSRHAQRRGWIG